MGRKNSTTGMCSSSRPHNCITDHLASLIGRERSRNVTKMNKARKTAVFSLSNMQICDVLEVVVLA